jgi:hypothetical protein
MTRHEIRAGLYVQFNMLVFEQPNNTVRVEYDPPSSLLNQFGNAEVSEVAAQLDVKIDGLSRKRSSCRGPEAKVTVPVVYRARSAGGAEWLPPGTAPIRGLT